MDDSPNILKAIATNDPDAKIYSMVRVLTLCVFAFSHVIVATDFYKTGKFALSDYVWSEMQIIYLYAVAKFIVEGLPTMMRGPFNKIDSAFIQQAPQQPAPEGEK